MKDEINESELIEYSMHAFMIPIVGSIMIVAGSALIWFLAKRREKIYPRLPLAFLVMAIIQVVCIMKSFRFIIS